VHVGPQILSLTPSPLPLPRHQLSFPRIHFDLCSGWLGAEDGAGCCDQLNFRGMSARNLQGRFVHGHEGNLGGRVVVGEVENAEACGEVLLVPSLGRGLDIQIFYFRA